MRFYIFSLINRGITTQSKYYCAVLLKFLEHNIFSFTHFKRKASPQENQPFFKQMPKPNEASSLTEDYVDDAAKHRKCDSSSIKENKRVYASKLNRSF